MNLKQALPKCNISDTVKNLVLPAKTLDEAIAAIKSWEGRVSIDVSDDGKKIVDSVDFMFSKITDAGLVHLKGLTELKTLTLWDNKITDAGLEQLKGLTKLWDLQLRGTKVADAGLAHLKGLTKLQELNLSNTQVNDAGVKKLQQALPNCDISH